MGRKVQQRHAGRGAVQQVSLAIRVPEEQLGAAGASARDGASLLGRSGERVAQLRAAELQRRASPAAVAVTAKYGVPGLKYAMDLNGYYGGPPRLPLISIGPDAGRAIEEAFRDAKG